MSSIKNFITFTLLLISTIGFAQMKPEMKKIRISGLILEKGTNIPLEYATVVLQSVNKPEVVTGGVTDIDGKFSFEINSGIYNVRYEFISFKTISEKNKKFNSDTNLGTIFLEDFFDSFNEPEFNFPAINPA